MHSNQLLLLLLIGAAAVSHAAVSSTTANNRKTKDALHADEQKRLIGNPRDDIDGDKKFDLENKLQGLHQLKQEHGGIKQRLQQIRSTKQTSADTTASTTEKDGDRKLKGEKSDGSDTRRELFGGKVSAAYARPGSGRQGGTTTLNRNSLYYYDDYYYDDYYYNSYYKEEKGKKKDKKKGKKGSKGGRVGGGGVGRPPVLYDDHIFGADDIFSEVDDVIANIPDADGDCELVQFNERFNILPATTATPPGNNVTNFEAIGTKYIFEPQNILEPTGEIITGTLSSGYCTRTSAFGGGVCNIVLIDANGAYVITASGFLDSQGGSLAVTGGSGQLVSVIGQLQVFPFYLSALADPFLDAAYYEVRANFGLIICRPQRLE